MTFSPINAAPTPLPASPIKNMLLALGMVLFLALSFKIANDLTGDTTTVSQTDSVVSSLSTPTPTVEKPAE